MNYSRVAIVGANGQIGSQLAQQLGARALPLSRTELDVSAIETLAERLASYVPDAIINAAAYTNVERTEDEAALAHSINAEAPEALAKVAASLNIPFIHYSTDYVFDGTKRSAYTEEDAPCPINAYGKSKAAGERAVMKAYPSSIILRTSWVNAAHGKNFINTMARLARTQTELRVVSDQTGAPSFAQDIAAATLSVLKRGEKHSGIFHLTNAGITSWHGLTEQLIRYMREHETLAVQNVQAITSEQYPTRARRPLNSALDGTKLARTFDVTLRPWQDALKETVASWYAGA